MNAAVQVKPDAKPGLVLAIVCVGIVLANLDLFIVNVGLPSIAQDMKGASLEDLSWVLNAYAIAYAALLVFFGKLAERHRRDRSFLVAVVVFTLASVACAAADSVGMLVLFRVVQAAGAALMTPASIGLILAAYPPEGRGGAVRAWAAIGGVAAALGPVIGGVLILASWRWIFLVNLPVGIAAVAIGWWKLPAIAGHDAPRPDPLPALLITLGIGALTSVIVKGHDWGWASARVAGLGAASVVCLGLFLRHCLRSATPFIEPGLFRNRLFAGAALAMAPYSVGFGAMLFSLAMWEQSVWGWSALKTGLTIAPGPLLVPLTSFLVAGRLIRRFGVSTVLVAGTLLFAAGLGVWAIGCGGEPALGPVLFGMSVIGVGVGLTWPTLMGVGTSALPPSSFATGSGVINMIRQASLAVGVAVFVAVIAGAGAGEATIAAFHLGWWIMAGVVMLCLVPTLWLIRPVRATGRA